MNISRKSISVKSKHVFNVSGYAFCLLALASPSVSGQNVQQKSEPSPAQVLPANESVVPQQNQIAPSDQSTKPIQDGVSPLVTPFDSVKPLPGEESPLNFNQAPPAPGSIIPLIQPSDALANPFEIDANTDTPVEESQIPEDSLPASEQDQIDRSLNEDVFFSLSDNSLLPTLTQPAVLGSGDASISEMAGLFSASVPIGRYSKRGLSFYTIANQSYDTNPQRLAESASYEGDWVSAASIVAAYQPVVRGLWSFDGSIHYGYTKYFEAESLDSAFQNTNATIAYGGARLNSRILFHYTSATAANREVGSVVDQTNIRIGNHSRYTLSPRTSLDTELSYSSNELQGSLNDKRDHMVARLSGVWRYSPMLEFGGGLRLTEQVSDAGFTRSSYGPSLLANYKLSSLLSIRSEVSMEVATLNDTTESIGVDASLGLNYRPSKLWSLRFDYRRSNQPVLGNSARIQVLNGVRIGVDRNVGSTTASLGIGYESSTIDAVSGAAATFERNFLTLDASISHPLYKDVLNGSLFVRYADQKENAYIWNSKQIGIAIAYLF